MVNKKLIGLGIAGLGAFLLLSSGAKGEDLDKSFFQGGGGGGFQILRFGGEGENLDSTSQVSSGETSLLGDILGTFGQTQNLTTSTNTFGDIAQFDETGLGIGVSREGGFFSTTPEVFFNQPKNIVATNETKEQEKQRVSRKTPVGGTGSIFGFESVADKAVRSIAKRNGGGGISSRRSSRRNSNGSAPLQSTPQFSTPTTLPNMSVAQPIGSKLGGGFLFG